MRQKVTVLKTAPDGTALISITRKSACSADCETCGGCSGPQETVTVRAINEIHAKAGDCVTVESSSSRVIRIAALLYLAPLAFFLAGWLIGQRFGEMFAAILGAAGFVIGFLPAVLCNRSMKKNRPMVYTIVAYA